MKKSLFWKKGAFFIIWKRFGNKLDMNQTCMICSLSKIRTNIGWSCESNLFHYLKLKHQQYEEIMQIDQYNML